MTVSLPCPMIPRKITSSPYAGSACPELATARMKGLIRRSDGRVSAMPNGTATRITITVDQKAM